MIIRLDKLLTTQHPNLSRSLVQKYIKLGYVIVDEKKIVDPSKLVGINAKIDLNIPEKNKSKETELKVIFENQDVIVVDKPTGILSHSKGSLNDEFTIADFFKKHTSYKSETNRPGIIHRLDRDTSGVMLGVKNDKAANLISRQFSNRTVKKVYLAVIEGCPENHLAIIDMPIGRNPKKPSQFRVDAQGKPARTEYEIVTIGKKYSLVKLKPSTGRTHQLRVHMAHIGHPILGDKVYGHDSDRLYLHANSLELTIPGSQRKVFESPVPSEFNKIVKNG